MSDEDPESKTEEPTEKRVSDALQKGQVAISREVMVLASLLGLTVWILFLSTASTHGFITNLTDIFEHSANRDLSASPDVVSLFLHISRAAGQTLLGLFAIMIIMALAAAFIQTEPRIVASRIAPKFSHLSIKKGWSRILGKQGFVEFLKALFKLAIAISITFVILGSVDITMISLIWRPPVALIELVQSQVGKLLLAIVGAMTIVAAADYFWSKKKWRHGLKMTRKDVSDELKQSEGDPVLKSRLRSLAQDRSRHRMLDNVSTATLILANPTHLAIALRYRHGEDEAPVVVAKGAELICARIREIASENNIPIFEEKPLTRALYPFAEIDEPIPESFFAAIAKLINLIHSTRPTPAASARR